MQPKVELTLHFANDARIECHFCILRMLILTCFLRKFQRQERFPRKITACHEMICPKIVSGFKKIRALAQIKHLLFISSSCFYHRYHNHRFEYQSGENHHQTTIIFLFTLILRTGSSIVGFYYYCLTLSLYIWSNRTFIILRPRTDNT